MGEAAEILEVPQSAEMLGSKTLGSLPTPDIRGPLPEAAVAEVASLPARWLFELPGGVELALHVPGVSGVVRIALDGRFHDEVDDDTSEDDTLWLDGAEWVALVLGAEADRAWAPDLRGWLERKRAEPSFRVSAELTLAGAQPDAEEAWSVARALDRLGASLLSVGCRDAGFPRDHA